MLKISVIDSRRQRRLILEGKLIAPWADELQAACDRARQELDGREFVVEVNHLTAINHEGEKLLLKLIKDGVRFRGHDLFTKQVLRELTRKMRVNSEEPKG